MAESTLSLARDELRKRVGLVLGYGTDPAKWDSFQLSQIDMCVVDGVREAYWPVKEGKPYEWSFMRVSQTFSTASGTSAYTMADSFWQIPEQVVVASGSGANLMEVIDPDSLIQIRTLEAAANATPLYAAFRPTSIPLSTSVSTRWECLLYPTPNATLTIQMHIAVSPDSIMSANNFPIGSAMFTQTLIAAVMATAEKYYSASDTEGGDRQGMRKYQQAYAERIQATMAADNAIKQSAASWAITEPEYGTFLWFKRSCSIMLFQQPNLSVLKHAQSKECEANVRAGLIRFYAPPSIAEGEAPWSWSFLVASATLAVTSGTATYDLPTDFATMSGEFNYVTSAADKLRMTRVSFDDINAMRAAGAGTGNSKYFCISQKASTGGATKSRYEVTFYPTPAISENYTYRYARSPAALSSSATYPAGNELHAETMVAAMRSVCEERQQGNQGAEWQKFMQLLGSSVGVDRQLVQNGKAWDTGTEPVFGTFLWFKRAASICLFQQTNVSLLSHVQSRECDSAVRSGLARFFMPPAISEGDSPWSWTFLKGNATIALVNGTNLYDLPTDFSTMDGDFAFVTAGSDKLRVNRVSYDTLMAMRASSAATGNPKYFCINPKSSTGATSKARYEVTVYPTPTTSESVTYRYVRVHPELTVTNLYPLGPESHTETMVAAIRSVCEERSQSNQGAEWQKFIALLGASVKNDKQLADESDGNWDVGAEPEYGTFLWHKRAAAICLFQQPNLSTLTNAQSRECDANVRSGLARFYSPPALNVEDKPWSWTFLNAAATVAVSSSVTTYDLPTDFTTMSGDFTYSAAGTDRLRIAQVSLEDLSAMQSSNPTSGNPKYFCISQKASTGGASKSRYEVSFFPTPSSSLTLAYRYVRSPATLTTTNLYALGSDAHTETIVAAIRSVCEERTTGNQGVEWQKFVALLGGSVRADRQLVSNLSETWSTSAVQYGSYRWLSRRVGEYLGYGANSATWSHFQAETVNDVVNRGVRQFQTAREWSFLRYEGTLSLTSPTYTYALPVDLVPGSIKSFSFSGAQQQSVEVCGIDSILNRRAMEVDPSGAPKYAGIRSVASSTGELIQRQEVLFFPKPDASYTLKYHYKMLPALLSDANPHPAGGESFAEAYLVSCRLIAATIKAGDIGPAVAEFDRAVEMASKTDSGASDSRDSYSVTALSMGTYEWFQQEIGLALSYGANPADWTFNQKMTVNSNIDRAHADFCAGYAVGAKGDSAHRWTFLNPETTITTSMPYSTGTVTIVSGVVTLASGTFPTWAGNAWFSVGGAQYAVSTRDSNTQITLVDTTATAGAGSIYTIYRRAYDFPANLHAIDGGMVSLNSGNCQVLRNVDARYIDETLPYSWECGIPQMFASTETAPGVSGVTHQFILKPIPDSAYQLRFRYSIGIPTFSAGMMCAGGGLHAQTILYCALANINSKMANVAQSRMASSIALDRSRQSEYIGMGESSGYSSGYRNENNVTTYMGMEYA